MTPQYEKLQKVLNEIFELDKADLDFGIYRIINQKRKQVNNFLTKSLPKQIREVLSETQTGDKAQLETELVQAIRNAESLGVDPESTAKVKDIRSRLAAATNVDALEQEVYSHLASFFKRYYKEGDFISMRRYKKDVYAIPYEGEEVKLYWANHDQYYIKTSENFKNYAFKITGEKMVRFQLKEASTEQNNNKTQSDQERRFAIYEELPVEVDGEVLNINFTYEPYTKSVKQEDLTKKALDVIKTAVPNTYSDIFVLAPTEKNSARTLIEKHLNDFISRNTFDYFIHKDLGGFLRRELDFYIKNEVLFIDDIDTENPIAFAAQLSKIKALKVVAGRIITFLAQIEDFQKKLWLKKKFVISTNYCITLDRIPDKYYSEIAANEAQRIEWKILFDVTINTAEDMKAEPFLLLDTKFFSDEFKDKLTSEFTDLDEQCDGLLISSENFQALNLLENRFCKMIDVVYIDPPYNTDATPILYKNNFKDSSWLSLIENRISRSMVFLNEDCGTLSVAIDDIEVDYLTNLIKEYYSQYEIHRVIVNHYPGSGTGRTNVSRTHEYNIFAIPKHGDILRGAEKIDGERERNFRRAGTGENNYRNGRPNSFFSIIVDKVTFNIIGLEEPPIGNNYPTEDTTDGYKRIYPIGEDGSERVWSLSYEGALGALKNEMLFCSRHFTILRKYNDEKARDLLQSVWLSTKFNATSNGTNLLTNILGKSGLFSYPKSVFTIKTVIDAVLQNSKGGLVLDYFGGSGTTAHAVIHRNRTNTTSAKYILVEMGSYFNSVTKPRIMKVIYSDNWRSGKPLDNIGISHMFKYQVLESYEDTLNNLIFVPTPEQASVLQFNEHLQDEYLLQYMLDVESREHLFNIQMFRDPFNYKLKVTENNELVDTRVDLVETFNYLIGLHVKHIQRRKDIKLVEGVTRDGQRTLVIWRNLDTTSEDDLDKVFNKLYDSIRSNEFDQIYINGDHHLDNLRRDESTFKVKMIEETFFNKMFNISEL